MVTSFPPVITPASTVLILGSMPGEMSLRMVQYYAHPRNHFWRFMEDLTGVSTQAEYAQRIEHLKQTGVALWDSLKECERPRGSADSAIVAGTEVPNDFPALLAKHTAIRAIGFNGKKSEQVFRKHVLSTIPAAVLGRFDLLSLPSTSPANASITYDQKLARWRIILDYLPAAPDDKGE